MNTYWPDSIDEVLGGDLAVMLADITPARGVVLTPLTNFGLRDPADGSVTVLSSLGAWRKLARIRREPRVALAFHTRRHGYCERTEYVLVQGIASFSTVPDRAWLESIEPAWERFMGPRDRGLPWERWMRAYQWERIGIRIAVERVVSWPDLACRGLSQVVGVPLPTRSPDPQQPPGKGVGPRTDHYRLARRASRLPEVLLGWVGADGFPVVAPVTGTHPVDGGVDLELATGLLPPGGRRAGLTAHGFSAAVLGQEQHVHTGWLDVGRSGDRPYVRYAPHTHAGYRLPPSKLLYRVAVGGLARYGLSKARRAGFLAAESSQSGA